MTSFTLEPIGVGKGFMHQIARLRLVYDDEPRSLPGTAIIKLPSTDPDVVAVTDTLGKNHREVRFYQEVAISAGLQTPYCYYAASDPATDHTVLLLEDMGVARQGDSVAGCSLSEVEVALRELAGFQASWWESSDLERFDWMPSKDSEIGRYQGLYADAWESLIRKAGAEMPGDLRTIGDRLRQHVPMIKALLSRSPRTIIHGDYRLDNCFLGAGEASSLVVFDWQFCARGRGVYDVATFITEALTPRQRRSEEMKLLRIYHSHLMNQGVDSYPFEECLHGYRLSMLEIFVFWIVVGGYCDYTGDRATTYLRNSLERLNAAIIDLDCADLLQV